MKEIINGRSGATMTVAVQGLENVSVLRTADTQVLEPEGIFRKKHLAMTALVPGLAVDVNGGGHCYVASEMVDCGMIPCEDPLATLRIQKLVR